MDWDYLSQAIMTIGHGLCVSVLYLVAACRLRTLLPRWITRLIFISGVTGCAAYAFCTLFVTVSSFSPVGPVWSFLAELAGWSYGMFVCVLAFAILGLGRHVKMAHQELEHYEREVG